MQAKRDNASFVYSVQYTEEAESDSLFEEEEFSIDELEVEIHCPHCGNDMAHDGDSLRLAESPRGVMFECGSCEAVTQWRFTYNPLKAEQRPLTWGGMI